MKTRKQLEREEQEAYDEYVRTNMYRDRWLAAPDKDQYDDWMEWADAHYNIKQI